MRPSKPSTRHGKVNSMPSNERKYQTKNPNDIFRYCTVTVILTCNTVYLFRAGQPDGVEVVRFSPAAVVNVTAAVMVLLSNKAPKIPKDRSWKAAKVMMGKVRCFCCIQIHPNIIK